MKNNLDTYSINGAEVLFISLAIQGKTQRLAYTQL